jgi:predicted nucleic acid-binding Zn ribbon protein
MKRPRTVEEVLRTLARVEALGKLGRNEDVAAALAPHLNGCRIQGLGEFLVDVAYYMKKIQTQEQYSPSRLCVVCDRDIDSERANVRFCSPKCRQKAYRERVMDNQPRRPSKCNGNAERDGTKDAGDHVSVTRASRPTPSAA